MAARQGLEQDDFAAEPRSLDMRDYWAIVRRRWRLVAVVAILGLVAGAGYTVAKSAQYSAQASVIVYPVELGPTGQAAPTFSPVNMSTEQAVAQSAAVTALAAKKLGVSYSTLAKTVGKRLSVAVPASTLTTSNVLQINWQADSPALAQRGANAFAAAYLAERHQLLASQLAGQVSTISGHVTALRSQISTQSTELSHTGSAALRRDLTSSLSALGTELSTLSSELASLQSANDSGGTVIQASLPTKPTGFSRTVVAAIGLIIGLLIGLVIAFIRDLFDDRLHDGTQLEQRLGAATLGELAPTEAAADRGRAGRAHPLPAIVTAASPDSWAADAVRSLRATMVAVAGRRNLRVLLVVAADASMSAGRVVAELGVALAESGRHVLLVASDIRGSVLPQIFDVPDEAGLSELLIKGGDPEATTWRPWQASGAALPAEVAEGLAVLPSGQRTLQALSILDSRRMLDLLESQRKAHDFVLLDAPPATAADILTLASNVDGVIVLAREGQTRRKDVASLRHRLDQISVPVVGGVLIGSERLSRRERVPARPAPVKERPAVERTKPVAAEAAARPAQLGAPPATLPLPKVSADSELSSAPHGSLERPL